MYHAGPSRCKLYRSPEATEGFLATLLACLEADLLIFKLDSLPKCLKARDLSISLSLSLSLIGMSPSKSPITKNKPRTRKASKKTFKQRKLPGALLGIPFTHYGVKVSEMSMNNDVTMMQTTISPSAPSRSSPPLGSHATTSTVSPPADFVRSQIPVSAPVPRYPDNIAPVSTYYGTEPLSLPTTDFPQFFPLNELQGGFDFHGSQMNANVLSFASNPPWQSYGRHVDNHQLETNGLVLPPRSSVSLGLGEDLPLHSNVQRPTMSHATNAPMTFTPVAYESDNTHYTGQCPYLKMLPNDGTDSSFEPFLNNNNSYHYM